MTQSGTQVIQSQVTVRVSAHITHYGMAEKSVGKMRLNEAEIRKADSLAAGEASIIYSSRLSAEGTSFLRWRYPTAKCDGGEGVGVKQMIGGKSGGKTGDGGGRVEVKRTV